MTDSDANKIKKKNITPSSAYGFPLEAYKTVVFGLISI